LRRAVVSGGVLRALCASSVLIFAGLPARGALRRVWSFVWGLPWCAAGAVCRAPSGFGVWFVSVGSAVGGLPSLARSLLVLPCAVLCRRTVVSATLRAVLLV